MRRLLLWGILTLLGAAALVVALLLYVQGNASQYVYASAGEVPTTTVAVVLGASVYGDGTLSLVLRQRAERAVELYKLGNVQKILVTGDNSEATHNEVTPVGEYLLNAGIPKEDIFLDHAGFDTYSSLYRARAVFAIRSMTIVSQPFHLDRAVFIARALGAEAYGVEAGEGQAFVYNTLREIPATMKALFDLVVNRSPQYLGPQFPVEGSSLGTWKG